MTFLSHLECSYCGKTYEADTAWNLCTQCRKPLLARYDLKAAKRGVDRDSIASREHTLWRYEELLPIRDAAKRLSLHEGYTPLVHAKRLGEIVRHSKLYIKDEGLNPTGSFKARGLGVAVSRAHELGITDLSIPSAGNAAGAMSAYAALGGMKAYVFMPSDVPPPFVAECRAVGAEVTLVDGLITDCGKAAAEGVERFGRFDVSTLKEPYRIEGKKTMGYELAEQFGWSLPDVIIYPTGGGTGMVGMWKAFAEMEAMGWIDSKRPRMVCVQPDGCAPMVRAFEENAEFARPWEDARTVADGLRVPSAVGDFLILRALRESGGTAVSVPDEEMVVGATLIGRTEGMFVCPEGGATLAAFQRLRRSGWIGGGERVVLLNTGSGYKYYHLWKDR
jgi:threonine synthase